MRHGLAAIMLCGMMAPASADNATAQSAAQGFYDVYRTFRPSDGIPSDKDLVRYEPYISAALDGLLKAGAQAEVRFAKANKNAPPLIEGDLFTSMFEGATRASVRDCNGDGEKAECDIDLEYDDAAEPEKWTDKAYLVNTALGWRVDDIVYGAPFAFGNKGRLSDTLRQIIAFQ